MSSSNVLAILYLHFFTLTIAFQQNIILNQSETESDVIPHKITTNYIVKYFADEEVYLSIVCSSENKHHFFKKSLLDNFISDSFPTFSYNILDKLDTSVHLRHAFNVILIDDYEDLW